MQFSQSQSVNLRKARSPAQHGKVCVLLASLFVVGPAWSTQQPGGRPVVPPTTPSPRIVKGTHGGGTVRKAPALVDLRIAVPVDCQIWLDSHEIAYRNHQKLLELNDQKIRIEYSDADGTITLKSLKPAAYTITANKPDHREYKQTVTVSKGQQNFVTVALIPETGHLTVAPSVSGALIEVINIESSIRSGPYTGTLNHAEFSPGRYRVNVSKDGYKVTTREIAIRASESVYLEPPLEPLPTPTPTPIPSRKATIAAVPQSSTVEIAGKELFVQLRGTSGDTSKSVGSINVSITQRTLIETSGTLNGLPCRVQFVQLENVSEGSLVEAPGPSNQWALLIVRIRPKDPKRPIRFAINWQSVSRSDTSTATSDTVVPADAIRKVVPVFPAEGKRVGVSGTVSVVCLVDNLGNVVSAKAVDGPSIFRRAAEDAARQWKFRPETRNSSPAESRVTLRFAFEKQ
jgi:TonB family protein